MLHRPSSAFYLFNILPSSRWTSCILMFVFQLGRLSMVHLAANSAPESFPALASSRPTWSTCTDPKRTRHRSALCAKLNAPLWKIWRNMLRPTANPRRQNRLNPSSRHQSHRQSSSSSAPNAASHATPKLNCSSTNAYTPESVLLCAHIVPSRSAIDRT